MGLLSACAAAQPVVPDVTPAAAPSVGPPRQTERLSYRLTFATEGGRPTRLQARVCFPDHVPTTLIPGLPRAGRYLVGAFRTHDGGALPQDSRTGAVTLRGVSTGQCVRLEVNLADLAAQELGGATLLAEGSLTTTAGLWLWRPQMLAPGIKATARVVLPSGVAFSAPWPQEANGEYNLDVTAFQLPSRVVVGRFTALTVPAAPGQPRFDVAVLHGSRRATDAGVIRWIEAAARAQLHVFRGFAVEKVQVVVAPVPGFGVDPVSFGMAFRGGGAGVVLLLGSRADDAVLPGEWVAVHELFHVGMPRLLGRAAWLFEGVTQYYTEVLRGRAGFLSPREAWQRLVSGFGRGRLGVSTQTLAEASATMHQTGAYQRVYWGGAAIALQWDVALRRASEGALTLDDAMEALRECCARDRRAWTAEELIVWLERWWGGAPLFRPIAQPQLQSAAFPELSSLWEKLGIRVQGGRVSWRAGGEEWVRDAIMAPQRAPRAAP
ncbi:MAG: hypothetical protein ACPGU1_21310 [Myxococcota bacterium]